MGIDKFKKFGKPKQSGGGMVVAKPATAAIPKPFNHTAAGQPTAPTGKNTCHECGRDTVNSTLCKRHKREYIAAGLTTSGLTPVSFPPPASFKPLNRLNSPSGKALQNLVKMLGNFNADPRGIPPLLAPVKPKTPTKKCTACKTDWCEFFDAYYGTDKDLAGKCVKCRPKG